MTTTITPPALESPFDLLPEQRQAALVAARAARDPLHADVQAFDAKIRAQRARAEANTRELIDAKVVGDDARIAELEAEAAAIRNDLATADDVAERKAARYRAADDAVAAIEIGAMYADIDGLSNDIVEAINTIIAKAKERITKYPAFVERYRSAVRADPDVAFLTPAKAMRLPALALKIEAQLREMTGTVARD